MGSMKKIEDIGLRAVSKQTHIEEKFLRLMIDKKFDQLNKVNTLGFVKILTREYGVDLSSWVKEFESYNEQNKEVETPANKNAMFTKEVQPSKPINKAWFFILVFIVLIGFIFWKIDGISLINNFKYNLNNSSEIGVIIDENTSKIDEQNATIINDDIEQSQDQINNNQDSNKSFIINEDANISNIGSTEENDKKDTSDFSSQNIQVKSDLSNNETNQTQITNTNEESKNNDEKLNKSTNTLNELSNQVRIIPSRKIWLGIIDLTSHKKVQKLTQNEIAIDLQKNQLIVTGHGELSLENENGEIEKLNTKNKQYYLVKNGKMTNIDRTKFMSLNRGRVW